MLRYPHHAYIIIGANSRTETALHILHIYNNLVNSKILKTGYTGPKHDTKHWSNTKREVRNQPFSTRMMIS